MTVPDSTTVFRRKSSIVWTVIPPDVLVEPEIKIMNQRNIYSAVLLVYSFVTMFSVSMLGPSLMDLADRMHVSLADVSNGPVAQMAGACIGSLLAGHVLHRFNRQIGFALILLTSAVALATIAIQSSLPFYLMACAGIGFASSSADVVSRTWLLQMWQQKGNTLMQTVGFFNSVGFMAGPLVLEPYVSPDHLEDDIIPLYSNNITSIVAPASQIGIPFFVTSGSFLLVSLMVIVLFFWMPFSANEETSEKEAKAEKSEEKAPLNPPNRTLILILGCILDCSLWGFVTNASIYFTMFAVRMGMQKETAIMMTSATSLADMMGVGLGIWMATRVSVSKMLTCGVAVSLFGNILLCLALNSSINDPVTRPSLFHWLTWTAAVMSACTTSISTSSIFAFLSQRIAITSSIVGSYAFCDTVISMACSLLLGHLISSCPSVFMWINMICLSIALLTLASFFVMDSLSVDKMRTLSLTYEGSANQAAC